LRTAWIEWFWVESWWGEMTMLKAKDRNFVFRSKILCFVPLVKRNGDASFSCWWQEIPYNLIKWFLNTFCTFKKKH